MVRIRRLHAGFGERTILSDVHLELAPAGLQVIVGGPSSGKSTLLALLTRTPAPSGDAWFRGDLEHTGTTARVLPDRAPLADTLRALLIAAAPARPPEALIRDMWLNDPSAALALNEALDVPLGRLSTGAARLAQFTAAVAAGTDLLVADEPDLGLPLSYFDPVVRLLRASARNRAVLVATTNHRFARRLVDAPLLLIDGRLVDPRLVDAGPLDGRRALAS